MHILVTGATRGIGRAIALNLAKSGEHVLSLQYHQAEAAASELGEDLKALHCPHRFYRADLTQELDCQTLMQRVLHEVGPLDALVNNAGQAYYGLLQETPWNVWQKLLALHVAAPASLISQALPSFFAKGAGVVVNIASIWGLRPAACEAAYAASKAGLISLTRSAAAELKFSNIRVNAIAAGPVDTDMCRQLAPEDLAALKAELPGGELASPESIAELVAYLLSPAAAALNGAVLEASLL